MSRFPCLDVEIEDRIPVFIARDVGRDTRVSLYIIYEMDETLSRAELYSFLLRGMSGWHRWTELICGG